MNFHFGKCVNRLTDTVFCVLDNQSTKTGRL